MRTVIIPLLGAVLGCNSTDKESEDVDPNYLDETSGNLIHTGTITWDDHASGGLFSEATTLQLSRWGMYSR